MNIARRYLLVFVATAAATLHRRALQQQGPRRQEKIT
jgi:hypothetical protein